MCTRLARWCHAAGLNTVKSKGEGERRLNAVFLHALLGMLLHFSLFVVFSLMSGNTLTEVRFLNICF